jgi:hypothetical protein
MKQKLALLIMRFNVSKEARPKELPHGIRRSLIGWSCRQLGVTLLPFEEGK